jgi:hypothetical protein
MGTQLQAQEAALAEEKEVRGEEPFLVSKHCVTHSVQLRRRCVRPGFRSDKKLGKAGRGGGGGGGGDV